MITIKKRRKKNLLCVSTVTKQKQL